MPGSFERERVRRASLHQKEAMLQFMEKHPEIGNEKLASQVDLYYRKLKWTELTKTLNKLPGKPKTARKWQKAWQDWRYNTRKKVQLKTKKQRLSTMEQRLLEILNDDNIPMTSPQFVDSNQNNEEINEIWPENEEQIVVKREDVSNDDIGNMLETHLIEYPTETHPLEQVQIASITTLTEDNPAKNRRKRRRYTFQQNQNNVREIYKVAKCVAKSVNLVKKICKTQAETSNKMVELLHENSRTLQSLAESQMRQAEALERQVSLEESRNSILKLIASTLGTLKKN